MTPSQTSAHLVERDPDAELLGEHRVGRQPAADPEVEAGAVLGVGGADERDVVDLGGDVLARVAGDRGLELARQVGVLRVADVAALDLLERRGAVDDLVGGDAGDRGAEERRAASRRRPPGCPGRRPRAAARSSGTSSMRIQWYWMFCRSVTSAVSRANVVRDARRARAAARCRAGAPSMRTRSMKYSSSSSSGSRAPVLPPSRPGLALGVEAPPAEPAAQVARRRWRRSRACA